MPQDVCSQLGSNLKNKILGSEQLQAEIKKNSKYNRETRYVASEITLST